MYVRVNGRHHLISFQPYQQPKRAQSVWSNMTAGKEEGGDGRVAVCRHWLFTSPGMLVPCAESSHSPAQPSTMGHQPCTMVHQPTPAGPEIEIQNSSHGLVYSAGSYLSIRCIYRSPSSYPDTLTVTPSLRFYGVIRLLERNVT